MVSCTNQKMYDGPYFVYFDGKASSTTSVNELGDLIGSYNVHYSGKQSDGQFQVNYSVKPGDGLKEGVDYEIVSKNAGILTFLPGIYSLDIRIHWMPHVIDENRDNSLTITLESSSNPDLCIGYPGPDRNNKTIIINKYKND